MNHDAYSISSRMSSGPLLKWTNLLRENFGTICGSPLSKQQIAMQCKSGFWQNQFENMSTTRPTYPCPWQFWVDKLRPSFFESKKSTKVKSSLVFEFIDFYIQLVQIVNTIPGIFERHCKWSDIPVTMCFINFSKCQVKQDVVYMSIPKLCLFYYTLVQHYFWLRKLSSLPDTHLQLMVRSFIKRYSDNSKFLLSLPICLLPVID